MSEERKPKSKSGRKLKPLDPAGDPVVLDFTRDMRTFVLEPLLLGENGYTVRQLAEGLGEGFSGSTLSRIINGWVPPQREKVRILLRHFGDLTGQPLTDAVQQQLLTKYMAALQVQDEEQWDFFVALDERDAAVRKSDWLDEQVDTLRSEVQRLQGQIEQKNQVIADTRADLDQTARELTAASTLGDDAERWRIEAEELRGQLEDEQRERQRLAEEVQEKGDQLEDVRALVRTAEEDLAQSEEKLVALFSARTAEADERELHRSGERALEEADSVVTEALAAMQDELTHRQLAPALPSVEGPIDPPPETMRPGRRWGPIRSATSEGALLVTVLRGLVDNSGKSLEDLCSELATSATRLDMYLYGDQLPPAYQVSRLVRATVPPEEVERTEVDAIVLLDQARRAVKERGGDAGEETTGGDWMQGLVDRDRRTRKTVGIVAAALTVALIAATLGYLLKPFLDKSNAGPGAHPSSSASPSPHVSAGSSPWSFSTGSPIHSSPVVTDSSVYFATDSAVYALNAATGKRLWKRRIAVAQATSGVGPTVSNNVAYVGDKHGNLHALNTSNGSTLWKHHTTTGSISTTPAVADGAVYFGDENGHVYAVDAKTGTTTLWSRNFSFPGGGSISSPVVDKGVVYLSKTVAPFYALDAKTGKTLWHQWDGGDGSWVRPALDADRVFVNSYDERIYAYDRSSGKPRWIRHLDGGYTYSQPVVVDGRVYCGSHVGVYAVDADSGKVLWTTPKGTADSGYVSPAVADGVVYTGGWEDPHLYAFKATDGSLRWKFTTDGDVQSAPVVANGRIYFGSWEGTFYSINAKTGGKIAPNNILTDKS
ncbi:PQQ-binding-like beta-propeller repeat protein [Streptomyces sp. NPDC050704]|uniref:outer membrane protein assembly factor BamB family protein n=1 Tax=Streptomyces sp. NPDC050704 TaxID=3157219 RepID=UPI003442A27F